MKRLMFIIDVVEVTAIALLSGGALVLACFAMLGRYAFPSLMLDWTFEVTIFFATWAMFIGAARLVGQDGHVRVDVVTNLLGARTQKALHFLTLGIYMAVGVFLTVAGYFVVEEAMRWGEVTTSSLRIPLWYFYLSLPVAMILMTVHAAVRALEHVTGVRYHPVALHSH